MPRPKNLELEVSRAEFKKLKPLPDHYGIRVSDHFPSIDIALLYQAVAGRCTYPEGLTALQTIVKLYPKKQPAEKRQAEAA